MPICARLSTVADLRVLHLLRSQPLSATTLREPDAGCAQPRQCRCSLTLPFDEFGRGPEPDVETGNQHSLAGTSLHKDDFGMWIMHFGLSSQFRSQLGVGLGNVKKGVLAKFVWENMQRLKSRNSSISIPPNQCCRCVKRGRSVAEAPVAAPTTAPPPPPPPARPITLTPAMPIYQYTPLFGPRPQQQQQQQPGLDFSALAPLAAPPAATAAATTPTTATATAAATAADPAVSATPPGRVTRGAAARYKRAGSPNLPEAKGSR